MNFKDILNFPVDKYDILFGHIDNVVEKVNLKDHPSIIITGSTGTSKSVMLHQILLQLINKNTPDELKIITINPTKVELKQYRDSIYAYHKDIKMNIDSVDLLVNVLKERINLFNEYNVTNFDEYNALDCKSLPIILVAIDEATDLLDDTNSEEKVKWIIENCKRLGVIFIMTTNNIYNKFFTMGYNTLACIRISFDFVNSEDAKMTNLANCDKLKLNEFLIEVNHLYSQKKCETFYFEDTIIEEILNKKSTN